MEWLRTYNTGDPVPLDIIPEVEYYDFFTEVAAMLSDNRVHVANYFALPDERGYRLLCLILDDRTSEVLISSHRVPHGGKEGLESISALRAEINPFEREISELHGIRFLRSPWDKPLRFTHNGGSKTDIDDYPFYTIDGDSLHEVNVGPIHAGIIEPGAFRFICNGERVLHLEIALGYQHRGIEQLMLSTGNLLRQNVLAESIAGDSAVSHASAFCGAMEKLSGRMVDEATAVERAVAVEMERIAMHIADTGALCMDIGYQLGQVASEALRTIVINTTAAWCGSRFGKGLVRPLGTRYPLDREMCDRVLVNLEEVGRRYREVREDLKSTPSLLARFEDCGSVSRYQLDTIGAVGLAARASGLERDIRATHPDRVWSAIDGFTPRTKEQGDIMARLMLRGNEVFDSIDIIRKLLADLSADTIAKEPLYDLKLMPSALSFSLVEGWRGEICHCAVTNADGNLAAYKIKDPSMHNWLALALAVRGEGISDFPICNKSFNLSYCGHDL